jgi:hypothetical protein
MDIEDKFLTTLLLTVKKTQATDWRPPTIPDVQVLAQTTPTPHMTGLLPSQTCNMRKAVVSRCSSVMLYNQLHQ